MEQLPKSLDPYNPPDPLSASEDLTTLHREQSAMKDDYTDKERSEYRRERVREIKENLQQQYIGVAKCIDALYGKVYSDENTSEFDLENIVKEYEQHYGLNRRQRNRLHLATMKYFRNHENIKNFRHKYPDDDSLFEACFEVKPEGKIAINIGPMDIYIQCFNPKDYEKAFSYYATSSPTEIDINDVIGRARSTLGAALGTTGIALTEVSNLVAIENSSSLLKTQYETVQHKKQFRKSEYVLPEIHSGPIILEGKWGNIWEISKHYLNDDNTGMYIISIKHKRASTNDVISIKHFFDGPKLGFQIGNEKIVKELSVPINIYSDELCSIVFTDGETKIVNDTNDPITVTHSEIKVHENVLDQDRSNNVRIHEVQHLFNRLFIPSERDKVLVKDKYELFSKDSPELSKFYHLYELIRDYRREKIDTRARDEILATFKDGKSIADIKYRMTQSDLYDYYNKDKSNIINRIGKLSKITDEHAQDNPNVKDVSWDEEDIRDFTDAVFKDEYKRDVENWINLLLEFQLKGYTRDEIVSLLTQEPSNNWFKLKQRIKDKKLVS